MTLGDVYCSALGGGKHLPSSSAVTCLLGFQGLAVGHVDQ